MNDDATFVRDRLEITDLIHRYAHHADAGELDAFVALFADDAVLGIGLPGVRDKASLARAMQQRPAPAADTQTRHVMTNLVFHEQSTEAASGALYFTFISTTAGKPTPLMTGQYTFTVGREGGRWRIRRWLAIMDGVVPNTAAKGAQ